VSREIAERKEDEEEGMCDDVVIKQEMMMLDAEHYEEIAVGGDVFEFLNVKTGRNGSGASAKWDDLQLELIQSNQR
jgi:hypothetical protein